MGAHPAHYIEIDYPLPEAPTRGKTSPPMRMMPDDQQTAAAIRRAAGSSGVTTVSADGVTRVIRDTERRHAPATSRLPVAWRGRYHADSRDPVF